MRRKTKIGVILSLIGALILIIIMTTPFWYSDMPSDTNTLIIVSIFAIIGSILLIIGGYIIRTRFQRWMDKD